MATAATGMSSPALCPRSSTPASRPAKPTSNIALQRLHGLQRPPSPRRGPVRASHVVGRRRFKPPSAPSRVREDQFRRPGEDTVLQGGVSSYQLAGSPNRQPPTKGVVCGANAPKLWKDGTLGRRRRCRMTNPGRQRRRLTGPACPACSAPVLTGWRPSGRRCPDPKMGRRGDGRGEKRRCRAALMIRGSRPRGKSGCLLLGDVPVHTAKTRGRKGTSLSLDPDSRRT